MPKSLCCERSQSQNCLLYESIYVKFRNCKLNYWDKSFHELPRAGNREEQSTKGHGKLLSDENVLYFNRLTHISKLIKVFILNECGLVYADYLNKREISTSYFKRKLLCKPCTINSMIPIAQPHHFAVMGPVKLLNLDEPRCS